MRLAIKLAYLGRDFFGSQRQPDKRTVEGELLRALEKCAQIENFQSAGRTDRGVSALCMVFAFNCEKLNLSQLNHHLPNDMCCYAQAQTPPGFNPRFAKERHYRYFLPQGTGGFEEGRPMANLPHGALNLKKMQSAAKLLEGTHDFSNFCKKSERNPVRKIRKITVSRAHIDFFAESFLWEQVRRMAYFIVQAGRSESPKASNSKQQKSKALSNPFLPGNPVPPLPPENLLLAGIKYPKLKFQANPKILSDFKSRMGALAEKKRIENTICGAFMALKP